jgi:chromosome segregation ATPase
MDQELQIGKIQGRVENLNKTLDSLVGDIGNAREAVRTVVNDLKAYVSSQKTGSTTLLTKNDREALDGQIRQLSDDDIRISKYIDETNRALLSLKENDQKSIEEFRAQQKAIEEKISEQQANIQLNFSRVNDTIKRSSQDLSGKLNDLYSGLDSITAKVANHDVQLQKIESSTPCLPQSQTQMKAEHWRMIQQGLNDRGFDPGSADGKPGPNTQRAIRQFQAATGQLPVTGRLTADEIKQLLPALNTPCPNSVGGVTSVVG